MNNQEVCIVIPAMNEEDTIGKIVSRACSLNYKVIVVDDASIDNTALVAKNAGAQVLSPIKNLGAWKATQTGLRLADKLGYKIVVTMDADGQHNVEDIAILVNRYNQGADVVIGNCTERGSKGRHIAWQFFKHINRLPVSDITSGFRLYNERALKCLTSRQATMFEYQCIGVLLMLRNMNLLINEVSVAMNDRDNGSSRIFHSWFAVGYYLLYSGLLSVTKAFPTKKERYFKRLTGLNNFD
ncbi:glycosyltransferase family 2 protein [Thalassotalea piscium]